MGVSLRARQMCVLVAGCGLILSSVGARAEEAGDAVEPAQAGSESTALKNAPSAESEKAAKVPAATPAPESGSGAVPTAGAVVDVPTSPPKADEELQALRRRGQARVGVFAGYGFGQELKFKSARYPVGTPSDETSELGYQTSGAPVFGVEAWVPGFNNWGALAGLAIDLNREVKSFNFKSPSGAQPASGLVPASGTKLSQYSVYFNIFYRYGRVYFPFGLSYSLVSMTSPNKALDGLQGDLGWELGAGVFVWQEHLALEWKLRWQGMKGVEHTDLAGGDSIDVRDGTLMNNTVALKAYF